MKLNRKLYFLTLILCCYLPAGLWAQGSHIEEEAIFDRRFDGFKALDLQYEYVSPSDYRMKMDDDKKYEKGKINSLQRFNAGITLPLVAKKTFVISLSGRYRYQAVEFDNMQTYNIGIPTPSHHRNEELHGFSTGISVAANGKLFGKDMVYVGAITADGGHGFETVTGMLVATMILRKTETTTMSLGLYGSTSRSSIFPFFPIFAYTHRFANGWTFDSVFPQRAHFRHAVGKNGRFSGGYTIDSNTFYIYPRDRQNFPHNYTYNRVDARAEVVYEHFMTKHILFNVNGGFNQCYEGVLRQKYKRKDISTLTQNGNFFIHVGVAYKL